MVGGAADQVPQAPPALDQGSPPPPPHPVMTPRWSEAPAGTADVDAAQETMVRFFDALRLGRYAEAASLYGGPYATYLEWNPGLSESGPAAVWESVCTKQLPCLAVSRVTNARAMGPDTFQFTVAFVRGDGTLFELGPCCGSTGGPSTWGFPITVVRRDDGFAVMTAPVFEP
jgi:hypothetical protein